MTIKSLSLFLPLTLAGVMFLAAEVVEGQEQAQACAACHFCSWNEHYAEYGPGISTHYVDPEEVMDPSFCFFWQICTCGDPHTKLAEASQSALSDLLDGTDVRTSEWVEANLHAFRFTVVDATLEVLSPSCGRVYTWIALDHPDEARRVEEIIESSLSWTGDG